MITTKKTDFDLNTKILDKAEVIARTVMSQQSFYFSKDCNRNHRQLLETMVGAAIWYLPQGWEWGDDPFARYHSSGIELSKTRIRMKGIICR